MLLSSVAFASIHFGTSFLSSQSVNLSQGLVGHWKFDGDAKDATPHSNHGIVHNATLTEDRFGNADSAYKFEEPTENILPSSTWIQNMEVGESAVAASAPGAWGTCRSGNNWHMEIVESEHFSGQKAMRHYPPEGNTEDLFQLCNNDFPAVTDGPVTISFEYTANFDSRARVHLRDDVEQESFDIQSFVNYEKDEVITHTYTTEIPSEYDFHRVYIAVGKDGGGDITDDEWMELRAVQIEQKDYATSMVEGERDHAYIETGFHPGASTLGQQFSWSFWKKYRTFANNTGSSGSDGAPRFYTQLTNSDGTLRTAIGSTFWNSATLDGTDTWHHITFTYDEGEVKTYVNGELEDTRGGVSFSGDNSSPFSIGRGFDEERWLDGASDDHRIYSRVLNEAEIDALYTASSTQSANIQVSGLQSGLVGHWDMNGDAKDRTPYGNHGTVHGTTLTVDRNGDVDKAFEFNGEDDYIAVSSTTQETNEFTWQAWIYAEERDNDEMFLGSTTHAAVYWRILSNNRLHLSIHTAESSQETLSSSGSVNPEQWHHVVAQYDGDDLRMYLNGDIYAERTVGATLSPWSVGRIGRWRDTDPRSFNGKIDDVRIYNRALSESEINQLYDSYQPAIQMSDLQKGLIGHWDMNRDAKDRTPYSNHGDVQGATLTTDRRGRADSAYEFDGESDYIDTGYPFNFSEDDSFTVSTWVMFQENDTGADIVGQRLFAPAAWSLWKDTSERPRFEITDLNNNRHITTGPVLSTDTFSHVAGVYNNDAGQLELYVNGDLVDTVSYQTVDGDLSYANTVKFGWRTGDSSRFYEGKIDEVRIYDRALSGAEVELLYETY